MDGDGWLDIVYSSEGYSSVSFFSSTGATHKKGYPDVHGDTVWGDAPDLIFQPAVPVLSADLPWADAWTLASKHGPIRVGHDLLEGPAGALDDATVDAWMVDEFQPRFVDQLLDVRLFFVAVVLGILGLVLLGWLGAIGYLVNWFIAMANQGNFSGPVGL